MEMSALHDLCRLLERNLRKVCTLQQVHLLLGVPQEPVPFRLLELSSGAIHFLYKSNIFLVPALFLGYRLQSISKGIRRNRIWNK